MAQTQMIFYHSKEDKLNEIPISQLLHAKRDPQSLWCDHGLIKKRMMNTYLISQPILKRHVALPQDHGSWVFLLSPLLIGLFAGGTWTAATSFLIVACTAAFLIRQPVVIAVKAFSGRRSRRDLPAAWFWIAMYSLIGLAGIAGLAVLGHGYLFYLAIPGVPVFILHLYLVSKRAERKQVWVELAAIGVLTLAAPAAFWVSIGEPVPEGWVLGGLVWLQSSASIVYAYLRLAQRVLPDVPPLPDRLKMARPALLFTSLNLALVILLSARGSLPTFLPLAFAIQWLESIWGTLKPAVGNKPTAIGLRQLAVSTLFTVLFILFWG
jgi:hypothetical protein